MATLDANQVLEICHGASEITLGESSAAATSISSRRGSEVWKVSSANLTLSLKFAIGTEDGAEPAGQTLEREALVLASIPTLSGVFLPRLGKAAHAGAEVEYLVTRWIDGEPGLGRLKSAADEQITISQFSAEIISLYSCLNILHSSGWAHGDVQPAHFIREHSGRMDLIDLGLAQSIDHPVDSYQGGLVHFNAPEICRDILDGNRVAATPQSDVFSLASVVFFAVTGHVIGDYTFDQQWEEMLVCLADGRFRSEDLRMCSERWAPIWQQLAKCLSIDPTKRPKDANDVVSLLTKDQPS